MEVDVAKAKTKKQTAEDIIGLAQRINSFLLCQTDKMDEGVKKYIEGCASGIIKELEKPTSKQQAEDISNLLEDVTRKLTLILPTVEEKEDRETLETVITEDLPQLRELIICKE